MIQLSLTNRELVYLAAQSGATRFFGIPDPFFGMNANEIRGAIEDIKHSLCKKNYADESFDSNFSILPEVRALVEICARCQRYLVTGFSDPLESGFHFVAYYRGRRAALLKESQGDTYLLEEIDPEEIGSLLNKIGFGSKHEAAFYESTPISIPFCTLSRAQKKAIVEQDEPAALTIFSEAGCTKEIAKIVLAGFQAQVPCLSTNLIDLLGKHSSGFFCFISSEQLIKLSPIWLDEEERWQITHTTFAKIMDEFRGMALACLEKSGVTAL